MYHENQAAGHHPDKPSALLKFYVVGFILSIVLSAVPFGLMEAKLMTHMAAYIFLTVFMLVQLMVQVFCFMRLHTGSTDESTWNLVALIFTIIVIMIVVSGSLWIMYNLNYYMVN